MVREGQVREEVGMRKEWSRGVMEWWSIGGMVCPWSVIRCKRATRRTAHEGLHKGQRTIDNGYAASAALAGGDDG